MQKVIETCQLRVLDGYIGPINPSWTFQKIQDKPDTSDNPNSTFLNRNGDCKIGTIDSYELPKRAIGAQLADPSARRSTVALARNDKISEWNELDPRWTA